MGKLFARGVSDTWLWEEPVFDNINGANINFDKTNVLIVGAGDTNLAEVFAEHGSQVYVIDLKELKNHNPSIHVATGSMESLPYEDDFLMRF